MHKYSMDILTVILANEIKNKGTAFVKDNLKDAILQEKDLEIMDKFWTYFEKYQMSLDEMIQTWNLSNFKGNEIIKT